MILFDTHVLYWYLFMPAQLTTAAKKAIEKAGEENREAAVSVLSLYELVYAINRGRIQCAVSMSTLLSIVHQQFRVLPVTQDIAVYAAELDERMHGDPMDRMITATAIRNRCTLITADIKIRKAGICEVVW